MSADLLVRPKVRQGFLTPRHWTFQFAGVFVDVDGDVRSTGIVSEIKRATWEQSQRSDAAPDTPSRFYESERFSR